MIRRLHYGAYRCRDSEETRNLYEFGCQKVLKEHHETCCD
jgi:hypothetical protein